MLTPLTAVALRTVSYDDRHAILTAWSRQQGRVSLLVADGNGPGARRRRALTAPMSLFHAMVDARPGRDIWPVREVRPAAVTPRLTTNPLKAATAMFMAEVLTAVLRNPGQPDEGLWQYLEAMVRDLDATASQRGVANTPLAFLCRLAALSGFGPDLASWHPGRIFDIDAGIFRDAPPVSGPWLDADDARAVYAICRAAGRPSLLRLTNPDRQRALDIALQYITIHHTPLTALRTLPVLRALFA